MNTAADKKLYSCFFYGSLISNHVLLRAVAAVLLGPNASEKEKSLVLNSLVLKNAVLKGYLRLALKGKDYPAMIKTGNKKDVVHGRLCQGLMEKDIDLLDIFEGEEYKRVSVSVMVKDDSNGSLIETFVYVWIGREDIVMHKEWKFEEFVTSGTEQKWIEERHEFSEVDDNHYSNQ